MPPVYRIGRCKIMPRKTFRENMKALEKAIICQGEMVNIALEHSVEALRDLMS